MAEIDTLNNSIAKANELIKQKSQQTGTPFQTLSTLDTPAEPTVGSMFQAPSMEAELKPYEDVDEDKIRRDVLNRYQGQIDATKRVYSTLLGDTKLQGQGRLGENTAQQARGGLLGSDFGQAQTDKTRQFNRSEEEKVLESQATAIANIMAQANQDASAEVAAKRAAKQYGYSAYQDYQSKASERKQNNLAKLSTAFLRQGLDPQTLGTQLKEIAKNYGVTESEVINSYLNAKYEEDKANEKEAPKGVTLSQGQTYLEYNPETGKYESVASVEKAPKSEDLTPYQRFTATQSIAKDTQARTENAREMARQAKLIEDSYANIVGGGDRSLNTQAIVTSFNKILDPTSVVRESEYDRTAAGQSLISQLQGKVQQIATGGAGITDETIKEAAEIARQYLTQSQASILAENERAILMAQEFGLNEDFVTTGGYESGSEFEEEW